MHHSLSLRAYPSNLSAAFANDETGTSSAAAIPLTVCHVGLASPRSINESVLGATPAFPPRRSRLVPCFSRNWRMALPSAGCGYGVCLDLGVKIYL